MTPDLRSRLLVAAEIERMHDGSSMLSELLRDAASALASPPTRFAWLLERTVPNGPHYYDGTTNGTADPLKAVQFARRQDAEWGQAQVPYGSTCWTVVEHGFMAALASPPEHEVLRASEQPALSEGQDLRANNQTAPRTMFGQGAYIPDTGTER